MPAEDYAPTASDVAVILRAYTRGEYGNEAGDFTDATVPTREQVEQIIAHVLPLVAGRIGADQPEVLRPAAKSLVTLRAAMAVVRSLMREGDGQEGDLYNALRDEYREALADFDAAARKNSSADRAAGAGLGVIGVGTAYTR